MITEDEIIDIVISVSDNAIKKENFDSTSNLVGPNSIFDSLGLVQLCIALEDKASQIGFEFDWKSEKAMSTMSSIFKNPESLAIEFNKQFSEQKNK